MFLYVTSKYIVDNMGDRISTLGVPSKKMHVMTLGR